MENWNSTLLELAKKAAETGQDIYGFILEQSPELVKEVIFWGIFENSTAAAFEFLWISLILFGFYLLYKACKNNKSLYWDEGSGMPQPWTPAVMFLILPIFILGICVSDFVLYSKQAAKAYFTPRIYIIEYTSDLINKNK